MAKKKASTTVTVLDEIEAWNSEDAVDLQLPKDFKSYRVTVASRDWTVQTVVSQIESGNIDLDPAFQRRNAWRDARRSRLIESFILGFPVPQVVLAENPREPGKFIVIDGKQRLLTIAGFYLQEYRGYWTQPRLSGLNVLNDLNLILIDTLLDSSDYSVQRRQLGNADIRTTVISGFKDEGVLYDIFYRINTGSVPLSSQELRQVLNRGEFSKYLILVTSEANPLWDVLRIDAPDPRLRDVELLLRLLAWRQYAPEYKGNMKPFLDFTMADLNKKWKTQSGAIKSEVKEVLDAIAATKTVFPDHAGRRFSEGHYESALNRALFEVQAFYLADPLVRAAALAKAKAVDLAFQKLSSDLEFTSAIQATTKSLENLRIRFDKFRVMLEKVLGRKITPATIGK